MSDYDFSPVVHLAIVGIVAVIACILAAPFVVWWLVSHIRVELLP